MAGNVELGGLSSMSTDRTEAMAAARLLTTRDVASRMCVSTETVLRWTRTGAVPAIKLPGGAIRFRADELEGWLARHATASRGE